MYAVLRRRRGEVVAEALDDGTHLFHITATLPVVESFGFAHDLRKSTSGAAHPQLVFSHFQVRVCLERGGGECRGCVGRHRAATRQA